MTPGNENIDQVSIFSMLNGIFSAITKEGYCTKDVKSRIVKAQGVFFTVEKRKEEQKDKDVKQDWNIGSYSYDSGQIWS